MDSTHPTTHPTTGPAAPARRPAPANADPASTGVMKALVLVDGLREERRSADDERLAALMRRR